MASRRSKGKNVSRKTSSPSKSIATIHRAQPKASRDLVPKPTKKVKLAPVKRNKRPKTPPPPPEHPLYEAFTQSTSAFQESVLANARKDLDDVLSSFISALHSTEPLPAITSSPKAPADREKALKSSNSFDSLPRANNDETQQIPSSLATSQALNAHITSMGPEFGSEIVTLRRTIVDSSPSDSNKVQKTEGSSSTTGKKETKVSMSLEQFMRDFETKAEEYDKRSKKLSVAHAETAREIYLLAVSAGVFANNHGSKDDAYEGDLAAEEKQLLSLCGLKESRDLVRIASSQRKGKGRETPETSHLKKMIEELVRTALEEADEEEKERRMLRKRRRQKLLEIYEEEP